MLVEPAEVAFRKLFPEVRTRRSVQNRAYQSRAASALKDVPDHLRRFRWIFGERGDTGQTWRKGVLVELGRVGHPPAIVTVADHLCRLADRGRLTTTEAVALVRQRRGEAAGRQFCKPSRDGLVGALCATLDQYQRAHPDTGNAELLEALNEVYGLVVGVMERGGTKVL